MRRSLALGFVVAIASVAGVGSPHALAALPGANGKIVYAQYSPYPSQIHVINSDGTGFATLTSRGSNSDPEWSIGGEIAYIHTPRRGSDEIMEMGPSGHGKRAILDHMPRGYPNAASVAWSPDGTEVAFCSFGRRTGESRVFTVNVDGTALFDVSGRHDDCDPDWSPDGQQLAVTTVSSKFAFAIVTMNTDGSNRTRITSGSNGFVEGPDWSPDGSRIAFTVGRVRGTDIATIGVNGRGLQFVTNTPRRSEFFPAYSPDGTELVFSRTQKESPISPDDLWTVSTDGSNPVRITHTKRVDEFFVDWQPV